LQNVLEAIVEAFSSLGEPVEKKVFCTLEKSFGIRQREISYRIEEFSDALEIIFGLGAIPLEISVVRRLHKNVAAEYEWDAPEWVVSKLTFKEYVNF
jgi:hypothetical protein